MAIALNPDAQVFVPTTPVSGAPYETYYCYPAPVSYSCNPHPLPFPGTFYFSPYHSKVSCVAFEIQSFPYPGICYPSLGTVYYASSWCPRKEYTYGTGISYTSPPCQSQQKATLTPLSGHEEEAKGELVSVDTTSATMDSTKVGRESRGLGVKHGRGVSMASNTKCGSRKYFRRFEVDDSNTSGKRKMYLPSAANRRFYRRGGNSTFPAELEFKIGENPPTDAGDEKTTVMIRNLPNNFTKKKLLEILENHCFEENEKIKIQGNGQSSELSDGGAQEGAATLSQFDFLYLPIDFRTRNNMGYAFVNFTSAAAAWRLYKCLHNHSWKADGSSKTCAITYARIQGLDALVKNFSGSTFLCNNESFLPVRFTPPRDGSRCVSQQSLGRRLSVAPRVGRY